jgi:hypothetical protein
MVKGQGRSSRLFVLVALGVVTCLTSGSALALPPRDPIEPPPIDGTEEPFTPPANGFDWTAESRFGLDRNGDRIIDFHWRDDTWSVVAERNTYDPTFVHSGFRLNFDGCPTEEERAAATARPSRPTTNTYRWSFAGTALEVSDCELSHVFPQEGTYSVRLTVLGPGEAGVIAGPYAQDVTVKDFLIVSIGDSYASGEGNPDVFQQVGYNFFGFPENDLSVPARWADKRCHRSAYAGAAQAAIAVEARDPKTSVTFLSFACSGATIDTPYRADGNPLDPYVPGNPAKPIGTGVLGPYRGVDPPFPDTYGVLNAVPSQIKQVADTVGSRTIDALFVSGGGNDIGFGPIATVCVLFKNCVQQSVFHSYDASGAEVKVPLSQRATGDIAALDDKYDRLAACLRPIPDRPCVVQTRHEDNQTTLQLPPLNPTNIYVTQYPDQTKNDAGAMCSGMLDDIIPLPVAIVGGLIAPQILAAMLGPFLGPFTPLANVAGLGLTAYIYINHVPFELGGSEVVWAGTEVLPALNGKVAAAAQRHGWRLVSFSNEYSTHGYCATDNWIRRAEESQLIQGPFGLPRSGTTGTLHPSIAGNRAYRDRMLDRLLADLYPTPPGPAPTFSAVDASGSTSSRVGANGWLTGRCPTADTCSSDYAVVTVEASDPQELRGVELAINGVQVPFVAGAPNCAVVSGVTCTTALLEERKKYRWSLQLTDGTYRFDFSAGGRDGQVGSFTYEANVDLHDPTASTATPSSSPGESGWYRGPVDLALSGNDVPGGSGVASVSYVLDGAPALSTPAGTALALTENGVHTIAYRAVDAAGRMGPQETLTVRIDASAPTVDCAGADGAWHAADVSFDCTATDADSGLAQPSDAAFALATSVPVGTETDAAATGTREVCDSAGNCATAGPVAGGKVDKKAPLVSIATPSATAYSLNQAVAAGYTCDDGGSGVATCAGPVARGANFDTASVGSKTFAVSATDAVGNSAGASVAYQVNYVFSGFFFPVANPPALNVYPAGGIVPIRFGLAGNQGQDVLAAGYPKSAQVACTSPGAVDGTEPTAAPFGIGVVYVGLLKQYAYAWQTNKSWRRTCRQFVLKLKDGTVYRANFRFG